MAIKERLAKNNTLTEEQIERGLSLAHAPRLPRKITGLLAPEVDKNITNLTNEGLKDALQATARWADTLHKLQKAGLDLGHGDESTKHKLKILTVVSSTLISEYAARHWVDISESELKRNPEKLLDQVCSQLNHGDWQSTADSPILNLDAEKTLARFLLDPNAYKKIQVGRNKLTQRQLDWAISQIYEPSSR